MKALRDSWRVSRSIVLAAAGARPAAASVVRIDPNRRERPRYSFSLEFGAHRVWMVTSPGAHVTSIGSGQAMWARLGLHRTCRRSLTCTPGWQSCQHAPAPSGPPRNTAIPIPTAPWRPQDRRLRCAPRRGTNVTLPACPSPAARRGRRGDACSDQSPPGQPPCTKRSLPLEAAHRPRPASTRCPG